MSSAAAIPSPEEHEAHVDDVARLLAAERPAALAQRLEHVAVADRRGRDLDAGGAHRGVEAVVGHHGHGDAVAGQAVVGAQVQRGERDQLVAVDDRAVAVDREHAVAVAVEGEAGVVAPLAHRLREALDVGGAAAVVDVAPVRVGREQVDLGAEAAEDLRRGAVGRAVGAVEQHAPAAQVELGEALVQPAQVVLERAVQPPHGADAGRVRRRVVERRLDLDLGVVVELEAVAARRT